jgi:hypothetical protein
MCLAIALRISLTQLVYTGKGSRKNKFTFSRVEAPAWQGAKESRKHNVIFGKTIKTSQAFATQPGRTHRHFKMWRYFCACPKCPRQLPIQRNSSTPYPSRLVTLYMGVANWAGKFVVVKYRYLYNKKWKYKRTFRE